jgi:RNA polymerase sigma-70 factor, ECF subfamily
MAGPAENEASGVITRLLREASGGDREAFDALFPLVYAELNRLARLRLRSEQPGHTLNTTALVHETYLKLVDQSRVEWRSREQFFAVASEAMRRILIDYARRRRAVRRGGIAGHVSLEDAGELPASAPLLDEDQADELIALDDALRRLAGFNPQGARIVQYRFFAGLTTDEVAELLGTSDRTVRRSWTVARAWLRREIGDALDRTSTALLGQTPGSAH